MLSIYNSRIFEEFELPPLPSLVELQPPKPKEYHLPPIPTREELMDPDYDTVTRKIIRNSNQAYPPEADPQLNGPQYAGKY